MPTGAGEACVGTGQGTCVAGLRCDNGVCCGGATASCCTSATTCPNGLSCDTTAFTCFVRCNDGDSARCRDPATHCDNDACVP